MRSLLRLATCALVLAGTVSMAGAVARHERVKLTPIKESRKTVGFKVKLTLYPESYNHVRIGVGSAGKMPTSKNGAYADKRALAAGARAGYIRHKIADLKSLSSYSPQEVEYKVRFNAKNKLKPGQMIDIVTAWTSGASAGGYWHVYGMKNGPVQSGTTYKIPR